MSTVFALVDCNNFYASCEKLFRPDLKYKPVAVLSNNDGCIVARSKEVKALGIKMGVPVFKIRDEIEKHGIVCFSSNYALYADLSNRVMTLLEEEAPRVEVYSIDEAFMDLSGIETAIDYEAFARRVKHKIDTWTGITVGIGIAPTKTLAKLANHAAKKYTATGGVVDLMNAERQRKLMALVEVGDVWGVGRRISEKLRALGIYTALDLADSDPKSLRSEFSVVLERTIRELNGVSCLELESVAPTKKQIVCSRSFGNRITDKAELREAIAKYTTRAAEKLRGEKRLARVVQVFIRTGVFNPNDPRYSNSLSVELPNPTDDTRDLLEATDVLFRRIFKAGFRYAKAGVMLSDFYEHGTFQADLFRSNAQRDNAKHLMEVVDRINHSGLGNVFFAAQGTTPQWSMKRDHLSPAYTTRWEDLPRVR
ncbi:translesion error-prone DNA polymerase V subunit UmuC [Marinomonas mediterranea]|jgi:Nucleotidyltransferase/DNA polymerase involved in DNA repair|uniref:DNA-directed DNA polymerase n=1 Tax=Marinomonas mediterranea (strain ATCC 700492 / JCM 21426 / NBRC 103028 / MMB-1) TaxID=717774 RepID=F2K1F4_MARM1|nr:translesion error-prone DNA polymerase V subunit UmuC [Marinomonas mediterranea]ADZ91085.1 DNA-directed DNA polymerase [Marinomonas mediterranea MMB-1]WCN13147.1 translesion error-prone DNA polymerase V subunit UmuC [Marinomonas mediterranea]WCN17218.1 translesion error-prone DNA polymerase V subunit UmuC [Marinomonas mediterranea MMB-1]